MSDTNEIIQGCFTHYDNQHLQVRRDFLTACAYDRAAFEGKKKRKEEPDQECMAKIIRLLETLTDHYKLEWHMKVKNAGDKGLKTPEEPKEYPIELTYGAISSLLSMQEPGYTAYGDSTIRNCMGYLHLNLKYIGRYQARKNSNPFYWLHIDYVQSILKAQAEARLSGVEINSQSNTSVQVLISTAKRPISTASPVISTANSPISTGGGVDINTNNITNTSNTTEKDKTRDTGDFVITQSPSPTPENVAVEDEPDEIRTPSGKLIDFEDTAARLRAIKAQAQANALEDEPALGDPDPEETIGRHENPIDEQYRALGITTPNETTYHAITDGSTPQPQGDTHEPLRDLPHPDPRDRGDNGDHRPATHSSDTTTQGVSDDTGTVVLPVAGMGRPAVLPGCQTLLAHAVPTRAPAETASPLPLAPSQQTFSRGVDPVSTGEQTPDGAIVATPPTGNESRASELIATSYRQVGKNGVRSATFDDIVQAQNAVAGNAPTRSPSGENEQYTTPEAWEGARDAFAQGLRAVWDASDTTLRKQYASRFVTYRAAQLRAWESQHPKPAKPQSGVADKPMLTADGRVLYQAWCSLFHVAIPESKAIVESANDLYTAIATWADILHLTLAEVLKNIMDREWKNDRNHFYQGKGVKLYNVKNGFEGWQSEQEHILSVAKHNGMNGNTQSTQAPPVVTGYHNKSEELRRDREKYAQGGTR
jgi:hypothetical protein